MKSPLIRRFRTRLFVVGHQSLCRFRLRASADILSKRKIKEVLERRDRRKHWGPGEYADHRSVDRVTSTKKSVILQ